MTTSAPIDYKMPEDWNDRRQALVVRSHEDEKSLTPEDWLELDMLQRVAEAMVNFHSRYLYEAERPVPMCQDLVTEAPSLTAERDYQKTYRELWKAIVELPDGTLNRDQVQRELSDYSFLMDAASQVYGHVSGNKISKTNTHAFEVKQAHDEEVQETVDQAIKDFIEDMGLCTACRGLGEVEDPNQAAPGPRVMVHCVPCEGTGKMK